eukprot:5906702-Pyramimonas_sp.AAC.1
MSKCTHAYYCTDTQVQIHEHQLEARIEIPVSERTVRMLDRWYYVGRCERASPSARPALGGRPPEGRREAAVIKRRRGPLAEACGSSAQGGGRNKRRQHVLVRGFQNPPCRCTAHPRPRMPKSGAPSWPSGRRQSWQCHASP